MLKSGGAGSGGKPDKSGGKKQVFSSTCGFGVGTNGIVPLFVPYSPESAVPFFKEITHKEDYRTPQVFDSPDVCRIY